MINVVEELLEWYDPTESRHFDNGVGRVIREQDTKLTSDTFDRKVISVVKNMTFSIDVDD